VANIGHRPTFHGGTVRVEAFLLNFQGDLYGPQLELEFLERLRGEQTFGGVEALKAQIARDVVAARSFEERHRASEPPSAKGATLPAAPSHPDPTEA